MSKRRLTVLEASFNAHEKVCTERGGNINDNIKEIKSSIAKLGETISNNAVAYNKGFTTINNRMLAGIALLATMAVGGLGTLVFWLLTRGGGQ